MLMIHLDDHSQQLPKVKASIVNVLSETVLIAAGGSVGKIYIPWCSFLKLCIFIFFIVRDASQKIATTRFTRLILTATCELLGPS